MAAHLQKNVENVAVSVVMAAFNGRPYIIQFVQSLLADLRAQDEVIVVDDASKDGTVEWLKGLTDPRVRLICHERNQGVLASFDEALRTSSHRFVFLADQDDLWVLGKRDYFLAKLLDEPQITVVISDAEFTDDLGHHVSRMFMRTRGGFDGSIAATFWRNRYLGCCMALRREVLMVALPIPSFVPMHDMWLGLIARCMGTVHFTPLPFLRYRRHATNLSPETSRSISQRLIWRLGLALAFTLRLPRLCYWLVRKPNE